MVEKFSTFGYLVVILFLKSSLKGFHFVIKIRVFDFFIFFFFFLFIFL
jgi:hypothetical protein